MLTSEQYQQLSQDGYLIVAIDPYHELTQRKEQRDKQEDSNIISYVTTINVMLVSTQKFCRDVDLRDYSNLITVDGNCELSYWTERMCYPISTLNNVWYLGFEQWNDWDNFVDDDYTCNNVAHYRIYGIRQTTNFTTSLYFETGYYNHYLGLYKLNQQHNTYDFYIYIGNINTVHNNVSHPDHSIDTNGNLWYSGLCFTYQASDSHSSKPVDRKQLIHIFAIYDNI